MDLRSDLVSGILWGAALACTLTTLLLLTALVQTTVRVVLGISLPHALEELPLAVLVLAYFVGGIAAGAALRLLWSRVVSVMQAIHPHEGEEMRVWCRNRHVSVLLLLITVLSAACGPEPRWNDEGESWDAVAGRQRLEAHIDATARMLPGLSAAAGAEDPGTHRDTLRVIYAALQDAEESIPPIPWGTDLSHAELHSKYRSAVRELRYGAEVMLESLVTGEERQRDEARYFIDVGVRHFHAVREQMERDRLQRNSPDI